MKVKVNIKNANKILVLVTLSVLELFVFSCGPNLKIDLISKGNFYDTIPTIPLNNPITSQKIDLGRKLFFDTNLSSNKQVACASCHMTAKAFTDGSRFSPHGVSGKNQTRNSPPLFNLVYQTSFFWDGGKTTLENQAFGPLRNEHEMDADLDSVINYLNNQTNYQELFQQAFKSAATKSNLVMAIASYERSLISFNSKWDQSQIGKYSFTENEIAGQKIFDRKCKACHTPPLFTDLKFHNNGLDSIYGTEFDDHKNGRYRITGTITDLGKFKTPSLRNLTYTAPYMHNGKFRSLKEVLNHYQRPQKSKTLSPLLQRGIYLTDKEKVQLLIFLQTLNDTKFTQNENHT